MKPTGNSDGPDAKKAKVDPNETVVMKKVDGLSRLQLYEHACVLITLDNSDRYWYDPYQTTSFCTLKEALGIDWTSEKAKGRLKKTPVEYFMLHGN